MSKEWKLIDGCIIKLNMLMTHYKLPINHTETRMKECETILNRWLKSCEFSDSLPPVEFMECLCDDINTAKMVALMHQYRKQDGKKLFSCLRWLGFFEKENNVCVAEIKTIPTHPNLGFETIRESQ